MRDKLSKLGVVLLACLLLTVIGVDVYYILHNAEWLIGDDAFMLRRTAWGIPFPISESVLPDIGFFRPFDYQHENIVLLFHSGMHSAFEHYIINVGSFMLCMGALVGILWMTVKPRKVVDYALIVLSVITIASRLIAVYINIFGPIFGVYTSHMLAMLFLCIFIKNDKAWAMILSILCWTYSMLIYENVCMAVGCIGLFPLLFSYKRLSTKQRVYCIMLLGIVVAYLIAYLCIIYIPTIGQMHYDPAHGTEVGLLENAKNMLIGQKFIWVAAIVWLWRQVQIVRGKSTYHILYDTLLWAAGGMVLGAIILRLNWTMYYYDAIILSLPPVVYFIINAHEKYGRYIALSVVLVFALLHSRNVPKNISNNQKDRIETAYHMRGIAEKATEGWHVVWYQNDNVTGYDVNLVNWRKESVQNYIQFLLKERDWDYDKEITAKTIVLYPNEYDKISETPDALKQKECIPVGITSGVRYYIFE